MKKLTVLIDGKETTITLSESLLVTHSNPYILLKKATIFWSYDNNIRSTHTVTYKYGNNPLELIDNGYHTFEMIKNRLETHNGITLEAIKHSGKCKLSNTSVNTLVIDDALNEILGRFTTTTFNQNNSKTSRRRVNINRGFKYISISCNIVDSSQNLDTQGGKSNILTSLAIPTSQSLFGSTQHFSDIESKVMVDKGVINQITFKVTDQDGNPINVVEILLECYIM